MAGWENRDLGEAQRESLPCSLLPRSIRRPPRRMNPRANPVGRVAKRVRLSNPRLWGAPHTLPPLRGDLLSSSLYPSKAAHRGSAHHEAAKDRPNRPPESTLKVVIAFPGP